MVVLKCLSKSCLHISNTSLPDEAGSVGHHSVRMILILSYVVDEGEDELHPRLNQHHIS